MSTGKYMVLFTMLVTALPLCAKPIQPVPSCSSYFAAQVEKARHGESTAQFDVASMYEGGRGVSKDYSQARYWYEEAAKSRIPGAEVNLGLLYLRGQGGASDYALARKWFERAAKGGSTSGFNDLGYLYSEGLGVPKNPSTARDWYQKGAEQGDPLSQFNLGTIYSVGPPSLRDYGKSFAWLSLAAASGYKPATQSLAKMVDSIDAKNLEAGKSLLAEYKNKYSSHRVTVVDSHLFFSKTCSMTGVTP